MVIINQRTQGVSLDNPPSYSVEFSSSLKSNSYINNIVIINQRTQGVSRENPPSYSVEFSSSLKSNSCIKNMVIINQGTQGVSRENPPSYSVEFSSSLKSNSCIKNKLIITQIFLNFHLQHKLRCSALSSVPDPRHFGKDPDPVIRKNLGIRIQLFFRQLYLKIFCLLLFEGTFT
jgi:hypothetical protein